MDQEAAAAGVDEDELDDDELDDEVEDDDVEESDDAEVDDVDSDFLASVPFVVSELTALARESLR